MNRDGMNRRDFAGLVAGLLAVAGGLSARAEGQAAGTAAGAGAAAGSTAGAAGAAAGARPAGAMRELASGVFKPQAGRGMQGGHESHSYLTGMLKAGNIRLEMHESVQQAGAPHEAGDAQAQRDMADATGRGDALSERGGAPDGGGRTRGCAARATSTGLPTRGIRSWRTLW